MDLSPDPSFFERTERDRFLLRGVIMVSERARESVCEGRPGYAGGGGGGGGWVGYAKTAIVSGERDGFGT